MELGDTGFSSDCSEGRAIATFRREACDVGADVASVIASQAPDSSSTCYRGKAELLRRSASGADLELVDDPGYAPGTRPLDDSHSNAALWGAIGAGIAAGVAAGVAVSLEHH